MNRIPKDRAIAAKWNAFLGFGAEKIIHGFICFEHFEDHDFKRKNKTGLKPHAVPKVTIEPQNHSIQNDNVSDEILEANDQFLSNDIELSSSQAVSIFDISTEADAHTEISATDAPNIAECQPTNCEECVKKDYLLITKCEKIEELRRKLKKANTKIWYLETMKRKLGKSLSELKQQGILNEKAYKALEVRKQI